MLRGRGWGLLCTPHPPSSSLLSPQRKLQGGRKDNPQRMGRTVGDVQPGSALTLLLHFCSKMLGPWWFYLQTPLTLSPQRRKRLAPRCPLNDSTSFFKKSEIGGVGGGKERKPEVPTSSWHSANSRIQDVLLSSFGAGFLLFFFSYNENVHFLLSWWRNKLYFRKKEEGEEGKEKSRRNQHSNYAIM